MFLLPFSYHEARLMVQNYNLSNRVFLPTQLQGPQIVQMSECYRSCEAALRYNKNKPRVYTKDSKFLFAAN